MGLGAEAEAAEGGAIMEDRLGRVGGGWGWGCEGSGDTLELGGWEEVLHQIRHGT